MQAQDINAPSGFGNRCGTSFSSPLTAGIAALALSDKPATTATQFAQALEQNADKVPGSYVIHGRVDAAGTLQALGVAMPEFRVVNTTAPSVTGSPVVGQKLTGTRGS